MSKEIIPRRGRGMFFKMRRNLLKRSCSLPKMRCDMPPRQRDNFFLQLLARRCVVTPYFWACCDVVWINRIYSKQGFLDQYKKLLSKLCFVTSKTYKTYLKKNSKKNKEVFVMAITFVINSKWRWLSI